ncbi:hypothetical protein P692DRAFT_20825487 [Suillus brevipes Sb2]|nr:hypothetical protein P692DRAFT_20825487 [Suillus brevipes Sb2]
MNSTDSDGVVQLGRVLGSLNYANVAVTTFWVYDCFLTSDDEVVFLTQSQWKWAKLLYIVCRYLTCGYLSSVMLGKHSPRCH